MSEETTTNTETTESTTTATPAEAQNTETQPAENMVPQSRFDEVTKARRAAEAELAKLRKGAEDAEKAKLAETQQFQKLYETEQAKAASLEKQFQDLQASVKRDRIKAAIESEARKATFAEPSDAYLFLDLDGIEMGEDDKPKNIDVLIKNLAQSKPYLVTQRTPVPGNGASPKPAGVGKATDEAAAARALAKVTQLF